MLNEILMKSILIYLITCFGLYKIQHESMFTEDGELKQFGLDDENNETLFPFWLVSSLIGILSYYLLRIQEGNFV